MSGGLERVREALDRHGLLPVQDARVASVCTLVAGAPVRGSWWGDPAGAAIYEVLGQVEAATPKLLWGKLTLVHRRLWPALAAVGEEGAAWQLDELSDDAQALLDRVLREGELRSDTLGKGGGKVVTELERRLLVVAEEVHTEGGRHARVVKTWARWWPELARPTSEGGRAAIEAGALSLGAGGALPW